MKNEAKFSKAATIILFVALIRTLSEPFRLQYFSETYLNFIQVKPFLIAALIIAVGLLTTTLLTYFGRHKLILVVAASVIGAMVFVKYYFGI